MTISPNKISSSTIPTLNANLPLPDGTDDEIGMVSELLETLYENDYWDLLGKVFKLLQIGKALQNLHPLTFLTIVFSDPVLKNYFKGIFNDEDKKIKFFEGVQIPLISVKGFNSRLEVEAKQNNLEIFLVSFAAKLKISHDEIRPKIQKHEWDTFYLYLFEKTEPQEDEKNQE